MPTFRYSALDAAGKQVRGTLDAPSENAVADLIFRQGHRLLRADRVGQYGRLFDLLQADLNVDRGLPRAVIAHFTRELSMMLSAGQDIDHALRFVVENTDDKRARQIFEALRNQVRGGKSFAAGLAEHPRVFSRLYVSMIRAGEASGTLAASLDHLANLLDRERRLSASIQSAMIYPALLTTVALGTIVMLLTFVLPQFTPIFQQAGAQLPTPTRILIATGDFVRADGLWLLILFVLLVAGFFVARREPGPRMAIERAVLMLPIVRRLIPQSQAARFTRTIGTLLTSGVSLVTSLTIAKSVLTSPVAAQVVEVAAGRVKEGGRLAAALAAGKFFPAQTIHLLQLGEETGKLGPMALRAAEMHDDQVAQSVQRLVALLVPAITVVMGLSVAFIVVSLMLAMLSLNDLVL